MTQTSPKSAYPEYDGLSFDALLTERTVVGQRMQALGQAMARLRSRHDAIKERITALETGETGVPISDHAVLRYLERVKGLDVAALRGEIRGLVEGLPPSSDQGVATADGLSFVIGDDGGLTTLWRDDGKPQG